LTSQNSPVEALGHRYVPRGGGVFDGVGSIKWGITMKGGRRDTRGDTIGRLKVGLRSKIKCQHRSSLRHLTSFHKSGDRIHWPPEAFCSLDPSASPCGGIERDEWEWGGGHFRQKVRGPPADPLQGPVGGDPTPPGGVSRITLPLVVAHIASPHPSGWPCAPPPSAGNDCKVGQWIPGPCNASCGNGTGAQCRHASASHPCPMWCDPPGQSFIAVLRV